MEIVHTISDIRQFLRQAPLKGKGIVLVPTMGALHDGHVSLIRRAKELGGPVVLWIFVNPLQFNNPEDLARYPRVFAQDCDIAKAEGVDVIFSPTVDEIYPWTQGATVTSTELGGKESKYKPCRVLAGSRSEGLCGATRPGHFDGVVNVISIFFNIIRPAIAVFGEKDFQQVRVVEQLVKDLAFDIQIVRAPIIRDSDSLALSSRNVLLSAEERYHALFIPKTLLGAKELVAKGEKSVAKILQYVTTNLERSGGLKIDYVEIVDSDDLHPIVGGISDKSQLLVAAFAGKVRLIDNIALT